MRMLNLETVECPLNKYACVETPVTFWVPTGGSENISLGPDPDNADLCSISIHIVQ